MQAGSPESHSDSSEVGRANLATRLAKKARAVSLGILGKSLREANPEFLCLPGMRALSWPPSGREL